MKIKEIPLPTHILALHGRLGLTGNEIDFVLALKSGTATGVLERAIGLTAEKIDVVLELKPGTAAGVLRNTKGICENPELPYGMRLEAYIVATGNHRHMHKRYGISMQASERERLCTTLASTLDFERVTELVLIMLQGVEEATTIHREYEFNNRYYQTIYYALFPPTRRLSTLPMDRIETLVLRHYNWVRFPEDTTALARQIVRGIVSQHNQGVQMPYDRTLNHPLESVLRTLSETVMKQIYVEARQSAINRHPLIWEADDVSPTLVQVLLPFRQEFFTAIVNFIGDTDVLLAWPGSMRLNVTPARLWQLGAEMRALRERAGRTDALRAQLEALDIEPTEATIIPSDPKLIEALTKRCDELELSVRSANCLQNTGIEYVWQLVEKYEAEMLKTKNVGRKSLNEMKEILAKLDPRLELGMRPLIPNALREARRLTS